TELASSDYQYLGDALMQNNRLTNTDLSSGRVPEDADLLLVLAPRDLHQIKIFAIDQFLMQGGSVFLATSTRDVQVAGSFQAKAHRSGLEEWLAHHGLEVGSGMVMDPVNTALPVPVERYVGTVPVREIQHLPYPLFPDLRGSQLNSDNLITAGLDQLTVNWVSPISIVTQSSASNRKSDVLLRSSDQSWVSRDASVVPDYKEFPEGGFAISGERGARTLALAVEGSFESYFKDKPSPLLAAARSSASAEVAVEGKNSAEGQSSNSLPAASVIEKSPPSARIVLVGSNAFASDTVLTMASEGMGTLYTKPLEFMQNVIDWSLEDQGLLSIRGRSRFSQTLVPLRPDEQALWEYLNYGLALAALLATWLWRRRSQRVSLTRYKAMLEPR
ncbi:MAG TPA: Gldg family protein, partial [Arenicellales bacterium]|nr:Gldg family protein [Arenicellales bacterium]